MMKHPFLSSCGAVIVVWIVGLLIAKFAFGSSEEAMWGATFCGMVFAAVALPLGIVGAAYQWSVRQKKAPNQPPGPTRGNGT